MAREGIAREWKGKFLIVVPRLLARQRRRRKEEGRIVFILQFSLSSLRPPP